MKKLLLLLLIVPMISFGQNNINYQAIVSNSSGAVISSQSIGVKLSVIYSNANSSAVYSETHTTTTTSSGLINIKLGNGVTESGTFANIDWSTSVIYLKSEVDIGNGYVNMGTQQIEAVPVALYAKNVNNININNNNTAIGINSMTTSPTSGQVNTAVGGNTLNSNSSGEGNTAIGYAALEDNTTGFTNVALGQNTLKENTTASQNVAVGYAAMRSNVTNGSLTAVGAYSLSSVTTTTYGLTAIGYKSLENNTTGWNTTALGFMSLNSNTTGADNLALGAVNSESNTTGSANTSVGSHGLKENTIGSDNTTLGYVTLKNNTQGDNNTAVGSRAGEVLNTDSNSNTFLGSGADTVSGTTINNSTAIGSGAIVAANNTIQLGNSNVTLVQTLGTISATAFVGDGSGLTNMSSSGSSFLDSNNTIAIGGVVSATNSVAIGKDALAANTSGAHNTAVGKDALKANTTGSLNTANGVEALYSNTTGGSNVANGVGALYSNTTGSRNVAIGNVALAPNTSGSNNTALGTRALYQSITGSQNTALGEQSGYNSTSNSSENTFVGYKSDSVSGTYITNSIAFGANAIVTTSNTIQLGDTNVALVQTSGTISATAFVGDGSGLTGISGPIYKSSMVLQSSDTAATDSQIDLPGLSFRWKKDNNGVGKLEVMAESGNAPQALIFYFSYHTGSNDTINFRPDTTSASTSSWNAVDCSWCASSSPPPTGYTPNLPSITGSYAVYEFDFSVYPLNTSGNHLGKTYNVKLFLGGWGGVHMRASYQ